MVILFAAGLTSGTGCAGGASAGGASGDDGAIAGPDGGLADGSLLGDGASAARDAAETSADGGGSERSDGQVLDGASGPDAGIDGGGADGGGGGVDGGGGSADGGGGGSDGGGGDGDGGGGSADGGGGGGGDGGGGSADGGGGGADGGADGGPMVPRVRITTRDPLPDGVAGVRYRLPFTATGGTGSYTWTGISVPFGRVNAAGLWNGVPPRAGTYLITVRVDSGPVFDQDPFMVQIYDPLIIDGGDTYLPGSDGLDVADAVSGGMGDVSCSIYRGPGQGRVPVGVMQDPADASGCTLVGLPDPAATPGGAGFIVVVEDEMGQRLDVPVFYPTTACNTAAATITPLADAPRITMAGAAYDWALSITDIDAPCTDGMVCMSCGWCFDMSTSSSGLSVARNLNCSAAGDVCSDCAGCVTPITTCPDVLSMARDIEVRAHGPIRGDGGPAWASVGLSMDYSGANLSGGMCGDKSWSCQMMVLELP